MHAGSPSLVARTRRQLAVVLAPLVAAVVAAAALAAPPPASAAPVAITSGTLDWGVRESFRTYVGERGITIGDGVTRNADGSFRFPLTSGSYDDASRDTDVSFGGSVRFWSHGGLLDMTITRLRVVTALDGATLRGDVVSRELGGSAELVRYDDLALATLEEPAATVVSADGATSWSRLPATLTAAAVPAFAGFYAAGALLDQVAFDYAGPGGKHAEEVERWTPAGSPAALLGSATIPLATSGTEAVSTLHPGAGDQVIVPRTQNISVTDGIEGRQWLDVVADGAIAQRLRLPLGTSTTSGWTYDVGTGQITVGPTSGTLVAIGSRIPDPVTPTTGRTGLVVLERGGDSSYPQPTAADAIPMPQEEFADRNGVDRVRNPLLSDVAIDEATETIYALGDRGRLYAFDKTAGGWELRAGFTRLPGSADRDNASSPRRLFLDQSRGLLHTWNGSATTPSGAMTLLTYDLRDGAEPRLVGETALGGAYGAPAFVSAFDRTTGVIYLPLTPAGESAVRVVALDGRAAGGARVLGDPIAVSPQQGLAVDQQDGLVYATTADRRVVVFDGRPADGVTRVPGEAITVENRRSPWPVVPAGERIYLYSWGSSSTTLETLERATSPTILFGGADATVRLASAEASGTASFAIRATGDPAPTIRWQSRAAGAARWSDLDGESDSLLEVAATVADDGARYRAMIANAAGSIATEPVTLTVQTPPSVLAQPEDVTVSAGSDAVLKVMPSGHPYPQIQWERLDGGSWVDVPGATTGFLTLPAAGLELNGTQYRARLTNALGTVHTAVATVTVQRALSGPVQLAGGHVDWGVAERWRCYVSGTIARGQIEVSGGVEKIPGTLATGGLCAGRNAGSEQLRWPVTSGSYDPASGRLELALGGAVRFWGHDYHVPGNRTPQLDTRISNLRIVVENGVGTVYADAVGATMENPQPATYTQVALVSFPLAEGPAIGESGLTWAPAASALTAAGAPLFGSYAAGEAFDALTLAPAFGTPAPPVVQPPVVQPPVVAPPVVTPPVVTPPKATAPAAPARLLVAGGRRTLAADRTAQLATIACRVGSPCRVTVPRRTRVTIGGKVYRVVVLAPARLRGGQRGAVRVRLTAAAARRLAGRTAKVRVRVVVVSDGKRISRVVTVTLRAAKARRGTVRR